MEQTPISLRASALLPLLRVGLPTTAKLQEYSLLAKANRERAQEGALLIGKRIALPPWGRIDPRRDLPLRERREEIIVQVGPLSECLFIGLFGFPLGELKGRMREVRDHRYPLSHMEVEDRVPPLNVLEFLDLVEGRHKNVPRMRVREYLLSLGYESPLI